jgi:predicted outer membrane protein
MAPLILALFLAPAYSAPADDVALWSAMHLTAQAAIDAGGLAQSHAASPEIRNLGALVVRDFRDFDGRLRALAATARIPLPDGPKPARVQFGELEHLRGVEFDRKFLNFSYGAAELLRKQMHAAERQSHNASLHDVVGLFDRIVWQDQFLSGWCLGHCVQRENR